MASAKLWLLCAVFICAATQYIVQGDDTFTEEAALITALQTGYVADVKPQTPTTVNIMYALMTIQDLDITEQHLVSGGWISVYWTDSRLVWNASDYANISALDVNWPWRPKFMISNSADEYTYGGYDNTELLMRLHSDGSVTWVLPLHVTTTCDVTIRRFPYDSQECAIQFVFFGLNGIDVNANLAPEVALAAYTPSPEWHFDAGCLEPDINFTICCPETMYQRFHAKFKLTRLRPFYVINLIIPSVALSFCMVLVFLLPTDSGERLGYSLTILLSFTVVTTIIMEIMPTTSKEIPVFALYAMSLFLLCAVSNFNVVINVKMYNLQSNPPKWLQILTLKLGPIIFLKCGQNDKVRPVRAGTSASNAENITCADINLQSDKSRLGYDGESQSNTNDEESVTWQQIADTSDRLCLYVYTLAVVFALFFFCLDIQGYL